jgi:calcineurin-like phosphoesterase family protein
MVNEMDDAIIERWNSCVKPGDSVYHLGDFCLTKNIDVINGWLERLNGNIRFIIGNHDRWVRRYDKLSDIAKGKIKWIEHYAERTFMIDDKKYNIVMSHFPMLSWHGSHRNPSSIMLHGHCHGNIEDLNQPIRRMDVGVDCNNWYPVLLKNIITMMDMRPGIDHHA